MYFDLHVNDPYLVNEANRLGYSGIALIQPSNNFNNDYLKKSKETEDKFFNGVEIYAKNPDELKKKIQKFRRKIDILIVNGGNIKINRAACEDSRVDILANPFKNRRDTGINHIIAKKAAENGVAIEIDINQIIKTRSSVRAKIISNFSQIIKLNHKFNFPIITTNNAHSIYDFRTPEDIIILLKSIGMTKQEADDSLSEYPLNILKRNENMENLVVKGVQIWE